MKAKLPQELIILVTDSLRFDSIYNQDKENNLGLPYIEQNANQYLNVRSNGCWTLPSTASIFTGLLPHEHGATTQSRKIKDGIPTLAQILKEKGYDTIQITGNSATTEVFGLNKGFDKVIKIWNHIPQKFNKLLHLILLTGKPRFRKFFYAKDEVMDSFAKEYKAGTVWFQHTHEDIFSIANQILEKNRKKNKRTFLFINMMETHFPYHIAPKFKFSEDKIVSNIKELYGLYHLVNQTFLKKEKEYFSNDLIRLLKNRQKKSWLNVRKKIDDFVKQNHVNRNNLTFFCSDHGDNFGDQNWYYHFSNLTEGGTRTPFFLLDNQSCGKKIKDEMTLRNIFHMIVSKLGITLSKDIVSSNIESFPMMQSFWYNKQGETIEKYKHNQFCFVYQGQRYLLRNNTWHTSPVVDYFQKEEEQTFQELNKSINPIEEINLSPRKKQALYRNLNSYKEFSQKLKLV